MKMFYKHNFLSFFHFISILYHSFKGMYTVIFTLCELFCLLVFCFCWALWSFGPFAFWSFGVLFCWPFVFVDQSRQIGFQTSERQPDGPKAEPNVRPKWLKWRSKELKCHSNGDQNERGGPKNGNLRISSRK